MASNKVHDGAASKGEDSDPLIVPLPNVCDCTLRKLLAFCEQQRAFDELCEASPAAQQADLTRQIQAWQKGYMQVTSQTAPHHLHLAQQAFSKGPRTQHVISMGQLLGSSSGPLH